MDANWCQGARCGHIDGKRRCGQYVLGEEYEWADAAAAMNTRTPEAAAEWSAGYAAGYRVGADGEDLPDEVVNADLAQ